MTDPLADVLATLGPRSVRGTRLEASGEWALCFEGAGRLKFIAVVRGHCWLTLPGDPPEALSEGDVVLLSDTRFTVASDPALEPTDGMALYARPGQDAVRLGRGGKTVLVGGGSAFDRGGAPFALEGLPAFLRIDRTSPAAVAVGRTLALLGAEAGGGWPGTSAVAERLAEILVIEAIRAHAATDTTGRAGWIGALADRQIGAALRLMHGAVEHPWTVASLAAAVGMSRSAFAARFAARVGRPPLDHLARWRMTLARQKLLQRRSSVAAVASEVGYGSQSAFSHAFNRAFGVTPRSVGEHRDGREADL